MSSTNLQPAVEKFEQPQNCFPARSPCRAVRKTRLPPHRGHVLGLAHTSSYDPAFQQSVAGLTQTFQTLGSDVTHATQMAHQMLYGAMQRQAAMLGYIDAIYIFALIAAVMAPAAFLMQKPVKGVKARGGH